MSLLELFLSTLSADPNVRKLAELRLEEAKREPGFLMKSLELIKATDDASIQLAAAIFTKYRINKAWGDANAEANSTIPIPAHDKAIFRPSLIQCLVGASPSLRAQFTAILSRILTTDYPGEWPEFTDLMMSYLLSNDVGQVYAGLSMLLELTKIYRWKSGDNRAGLAAIVGNVFPVALNIATRLVGETAATAGTMLVLVLKAYKSAIAMELPAQLQEDPVLIPWGNLFLQVIAKEIPESEFPADKDERDAYPWIKAKKWSFHNLNRLFARYAVQTSLGDSKASAFGKHFITNFAPEILKSYLHQVDLYMNRKVFLSDRCVYLIVDFLEEWSQHPHLPGPNGSIKPKVTWNLLKNNVPNLLAHVIFPLLCLTQEDLELWNDDPVEYIHKKIDVYEEYLTPDIAASRFLLTLASKRQKSSFNGILQFINTTLTQTDNEKHPEHKEAALRMIGSVSHIIMKKGSPILGMMESFLVSHVFPEFRSPHGYMRARACEILNRFSDVDFEDHNNVVTSFQCVMACLDDPELPVRCQAALALQPLLRHAYVVQTMKPQIPQLMQRLLALVNEIDADMLSMVMEEFVEQFSEELTPYSVDLAATLSGTCLRLLQENEKELADEDDTDAVTNKVLSALGILNTLSTLILSVETKPEMVRALEESLEPVLVFVLDNAVYDLLSEALEIIDSLTFSSREISPRMWRFFPLLHSCFKLNASDYLEELLPPLDNYIVFGAEVISKNPGYKDIIFDYFFTIFTTKHMGQADHIAACRLVESVLLNLPGQVDPYLPRVLDIIRARLQDTKEYKRPGYKVYLLETFINAIYYNPIATLQYLEDCGFTQTFFREWTDEADRFLRVHDKTLSILSLMKIVRLPRDHLPVVFRNDAALHYFMKAMLQFFKNLPEARKRRQEAIDDYEEGDSVAAEGDEEWTEEDTWSDPENDADVSDEAQEYLDFLAQQTAEYGAKLTDGRDNEWDELEENLREEPLFITPLETEDPYLIFTLGFLHMETANPVQVTNLTNSLPDDDQRLLQSIVENAKLILEEQQQQQSAERRPNGR